MDIQATLRLSREDETELSRILGCDPRELAERLRPYASAALSEYVAMFLGQKVFRRGSDIHEYRLFLLITDALEGRIPDEQDVCRLFQTTANESRALIRAVMSKFQYQLRTAIDNSVRRVLEAAVQDGDGTPFVVTINSLNVVEELNRLLASIDGTLQQISKKRGSVSTYEIAPASHARLIQLYRRDG